MAGENSEVALIKLAELFNHSSTSITRRYLDLRQQELREVYGLFTNWADGLSGESSVASQLSICDIIGSFI